MPIILCLETSTNTCSVSLFKESELLAEYNLHIKNSHSEVLSKMINDLLATVGYTIKELNAIAVSIGPGSYTGLRIGVSTAKGLAYGLDIPIIKVDTLQAMAYEVSHYIQRGILFPMIDARRMEVYTMQTDEQARVVKDAYPLILEETSFDAFEQEIYLFGNGAEKCKELYDKHEKIIFINNISPSAKNIGALAIKKYEQGIFEDIQTLEPFYLKAFYSPKAKNPLTKSTGKK